MAGKKLKELMLKFGMSPEDLASSFGVSRNTLYNWFKKDSLESLYIIKASEIFSVPVSYFFDDYEVHLSKPLDKGKFGSEVEEELRAQVEMLKKDKEFLQKMLEQFGTSFQSLAAELGKEGGTETKRLFLVPQQEIEADLAA